MKKLIWLIILVVVAGGIWLFTQDKTAPSLEPTATDTSSSDATATGTNSPAPVVREFTVTASNFKYDVKEIKVKAGETVKINLVNAEGTHDWRLDEFGVSTSVLTVGGTQTLEFVADKTGTFEYYCSIGKHREMGMKGNLIIE